jgi:hypothetical protein
MTDWLALFRAEQERTKARGEAGEERRARAPHPWAELLATLDPDRPPADTPPRRWRQLVDDCGNFLDHGWAAKAERLGWRVVDLFGCDRKWPFGCINHRGLLWLLDGNELVALSADAAVIEIRRTGSRQTFRRRPLEPGAALAWELAAP